MATIMITGKTELFTMEVLERLAQDNTIVLAGKDPFQKKIHNLHIYDTIPTEEEFAQLFDVYSFEAMWYVSGYVDGGDGSFGEAQMLENALDKCVKSSVDKVVLLSTAASQNHEIRYSIDMEAVQREYPDSRVFNAAKVEELGNYFADKTGLKVVTLWLPYVVDRVNERSFLGGIFDRIYKGETVVFPYSPRDRVDFIYIDDLADLLLQITDEIDDDTDSYYVVSGYEHTFGELEALLKQIRPELTVNYENRPYAVQMPDYPYELRHRYGFIPLVDVTSEIVDAYECFLEETYHEKEKIWGKILRKLGSGFFKYLELILMFFLADFISQYTSDSVYFRFVDVRLAFIVIMGSMYGMRHGVLAAGLEAIVLVANFFKMGMTSSQLFYNLENWIPFVVYLMAGVIPGYIRDKNSEDLEYSKKEYELLRNKYIFLNNVYHGAIQNKGEFKRQILGFKDSFGKIFDAVQKLDNELPQEIFLEGLKVMEDILENHTVAIYTVDSWQRFGRMVACSGSIRSHLTVSIRLEEYARMYETVKAGKVWSNVEMIPELPMYACGVFRDGKVVLLVILWEASVEQYGTHYTNIFQILCGLVQTSFLRAMDYELFRQDQQTIPGTNAATPEHFQQLVNVQEEMKQAGVAEYMLLRFEDRDVERVGEEISGMVRASDTFGMGEDGSLYLLLTQMSRQTFHFVGDRLDQKGLQYESVEKVGA